MKQLFTFVLAAMAFVACTQNEVEELSANRADVPETLTVGFEGGDTRIELNEALKTVWTEGDEVSVFYKTLTNIRGAFQGKTGDRQGNILLPQTVLDDAVMDEYVVIYPYNEDYLLNAEALTLNAPIPATQSYKEGSYGENGNIMADASDATHVTLRSIYGWLRVHLTGDGEVVESITLRGNNGEQLAGYAQIDLNDYSVRFISESSEPENDMEVGGDLVFEDELITEITLDCGEGVELGAEERVFYIALLPQTFAEGVTIEVNCAGYKPMTLSTESLTIERNHIKPMAAVEYEADSEPTTTANQLWYTATALVEPSNTSAFNVAIVSNEWDEATGEGIITFDGELTTIGHSAFEWCGSLTSVTIPDSVTTIGVWAFYWCSSLTSVTIPDSVTMIGSGAFGGCINLAEFKGKFAADGGRCLIIDGMFNAFALGCGVTEYTIPDSVTTIGYRVFESCSSLTSVTIPDSVTTIGDEVFADCSNLAEFKGKFAADGGRCLIKDNTLIAYANASGTTYTIPDSVTTIGNRAFAICDNLTSITIPDSVTTIGNDAFYGCSSLTSVTIPDSVTAIGHHAFTLCYSLTSVTIPDSVTTIGEGAFENCDSLTSVTIPDSVTTIGENAFYDCDSLTSVYCKATTPPSLGDYVFKYWDESAQENVNIGCAIYVPAESVEAYKAAENWSEYTADIVGYDFETGEEVAISNKLFYTATALVEPYNTSAFNVAIVSNEWDEATGEYVITFDGELTTIGEGAFGGCDSLTSVTIPDSVTTIGEHAFDSCGRLTSVTIPDSVMTIGSEAFCGCFSLTSVTIPDSVTTIGEGAFYYCDSLTSVTIGDSVTTIGNEAFYQCESLTSVYCKATTPPSLGDDVFTHVDNGYVNIGCAIYVPTESVEAYKAATNWSEYAADIVGYNFE